MRGRPQAETPALHGHNPRSGYALLFIYMMAATLAIMLYMAVPRSAFEAQRDREQLLIDRGEQYKRAIQLYVRKFNRYPPDIAALENTQNIRFLRKQYVDPMTGKNEWRLVHVGPGGVLTDSLVTAPPQSNSSSAPQTFITQMQQFSGNQTGQNQGVNQATRRRQGDDAGLPGDPNNVSASNPGGISGPVMVLPDGRIVPATLTGVPAPTGSTVPTGQIPGQIPGQVPGQAPPQYAGQYGQPGQPFQPGVAAPGGFQNQPNNGAPGNAASLINQILTSPRPGGLNGVGGNTAADPGAMIGGGFGSNSPTGNNTGVSAGTGMGGTTIGGGIAGVASKFEQEGIKVYNDQTEYNKWEFVYDMTKDKTRTGAAGVAPQPQMNPSQMSQGMQQNGQANPFGAAPTAPPPPPMGQATQPPPPSGP